MPANAQPVGICTGSSNTCLQGVEISRKTMGGWLAQRGAYLELSTRLLEKGLATAYQTAYLLTSC